MTTRTPCGCGRSDPDGANCGVRPRRVAASQSALALGRRRAAWQHLKQAIGAQSGELVAIEALAHEAALQRSFERRLDNARAAARQSLARARAMADAAGGVAQLAGDARRAYLVSALAGADVARMGDDPNELLVLAEQVASAAAGFDDAAEISALVQSGMALRFLGIEPRGRGELRRAWTYPASVESKRRSRPVPSSAGPAVDEPDRRSARRGHEVFCPR